METNKNILKNFYDEYLNDKKMPRKKFQNSYNFFNNLTANKRKQLGKVYRVRITKLLAGTTIPWHKDETPSEYSRLIIPIFTDDECISGFKDNDDLHYTHLPADGSVYWTNGKKDHSVFNVSKNDRYAVVLTSTNFI